ncbi:MAG: hypothetical protein NTZ94_01865 [Verrucomicrobia bacterium]|nr:hypothetical protein [Verrucomicrobiota bacterium]
MVACNFANGTIEKVNAAKHAKNTLLRNSNPERKTAQALKAHPTASNAIGTCSLV